MSKHIKSRQTQFQLESNFVKSGQEFYIWNAQGWRGNIQWPLLRNTFDMYQCPLNIISVVLTQVWLNIQIVFFFLFVWRWESETLGRGGEEGCLSGPCFLELSFFSVQFIQPERSPGVWSFTTLACSHPGCQHPSLSHLWVCRLCDAAEMTVKNWVLLRSFCSVDEVTCTRGCLDPSGA